MGGVIAPPVLPLAFLVFGQDQPHQQVAHEARLDVPPHSRSISNARCLLRPEVGAGEAPQPVWLTAGRKVWLRKDLNACLVCEAGRPAGSRDGKGQIKALTEDWEKAFTKAREAQHD